MELPIDDQGACIFHSRDVDWKRRHKFNTRFLQLVALLETDAAVKDCDFAEFVFVGDELSRAKAGGPFAFRLSDMTLRKPVFLIGALFLDPVELNRVTFDDAANCQYVTFDGGLVIKQSRIERADFTKAVFKQRAHFVDVDFGNYTLLARTRFSGESSDGYVVQFDRVIFRGITDFTGATFLLNGASALFRDVQFEDVVDFQGAQFNCPVMFDRVAFESSADFIDTSFEPGFDSVGRYRNAPISFKRLDIRQNAVVTFRSTDPQRKMLTHEVQLTLHDGTLGTVRFENVDFNKISAASRHELLRLVPSGRVDIGPGCIKYRHQTKVRTSHVSEANASLVVEICQTFANYFTTSNGINLGVEVVERTATRIRFIYFTDEDVSEAVFLERLQQTERNLWNLLVMGADSQSDRLGGQLAESASLTKRRAVINAVDAVTAYIRLFFQISTRMAFGEWTQGDTTALLEATNFNGSRVLDRAATLHEVIANGYTGKRLVDVAPVGRLPPIARQPSRSHPSVPIASLIRGTSEVPVLDDDVYAAILGVIHKAGRTFERLPRLYRDRDEEGLRDQIILVLDSKFDGSATGETFNKAGKTDILIRHDGKNAFVAECKIWKGQRQHQSTIDQLLGYLTWRDSKAAIVYFVRGKEIAPALKQIEAETPSHPSYVRFAGKHDGSWFSYVFHLPGDTASQLQIAVLCFHFPE